MPHDRRLVKGSLQRLTEFSELSPGPGRKGPPGRGKGGPSGGPLPPGPPPPGPPGPLRCWKLPTPALLSTSAPLPGLLNAETLVAAEGSSWRSEMTVASAAMGAVIESTADMGCEAATPGAGAGAVAAATTAAATAAPLAASGEVAACQHTGITPMPCMPTTCCPNPLSPSCQDTSVPYIPSSF